MIFFSIIMPVYNRAEIISPTIESVLQQEYGNFELLCINDGSSDSTLEVLTGFAQKDSRIVIINHEINKGRSAARNSGIKHAQGNWICFLDSDDIYFANHLATHVRLINTRSGYKCFATGQLMYGILRTFPFRFENGEKTINFSYLINENFISLNQISISKADTPLFLPEHLAHSEDLLYMRRFLEKNDLLFVKEITCNVPFHEGRSMITDNMVFITDNNWAAAKAFCDEKERGGINRKILSHTSLFCASRLLSKKKIKESFPYFLKSLRYLNSYFNPMFFKVLIKYAVSVFNK